jgi:hypothetical protein
MTAARSWRRYTASLIAAEISRLTGYFDHAVQYARYQYDDGLLFDGVVCATKSVVPAGQPLPDVREAREQRCAVVLNGNFNYSTDIQGLLAELRPQLNRRARIIAVAYNSYFSPLYRLASRLGVGAGKPPSTFVTYTDLENIARLAGFRVVRTRPVVYSPLRLLGLGALLNAALPVVPILRHFSLAAVVVLAPNDAARQSPSISVIVPTRNERGNIAAVLDALRAERSHLPQLEVVFVEGNSSDGTWAEIQRLLPGCAGEFKTLALQQSGRGKGDAVRLGIAHASGEVVTILDADLTVPAAALVRFYEVYCTGLAEFVNGSRLVYGLESGAMRGLNRLGNIAFAKLLSAVLSVRLGDSLCGTKLFARDDYARFTAWRRDFGDFDPFGDFELLFPAAILGLTIVDVPIVYRARTYGETNISRFRDGWLLLKMTVIGLLRVRMGARG